MDSVYENSHAGVAMAVRDMAAGSFDITAHTSAMDTRHVCVVIPSHTVPEATVTSVSVRVTLKEAFRGAAFQGWPPMTHEFELVFTDTAVWWIALSASQPESDTRAADLLPPMARLFMREIVMSLGVGDLPVFYSNIPDIYQFQTKLSDRYPDGPWASAIDGDDSSRWHMEALRLAVEGTTQDPFKRRRLGTL